MVVKDARDVGLLAVVRTSHPNGRTEEERVVAVLGERLILESGRSVDPRKQYVKVVGNARWRADEGAKDQKRGPEDDLGHPVAQLVASSFPGSRS